MEFWSDVARRHPDMIAHLPRDATVLEWGDEENEDLWPHCAAWEGRPPDETRVLRSAEAHLFADLGEAAAVAARDLADAYCQPGPLPANASVLFQWLQSFRDPFIRPAAHAGAYYENVAAFTAVRRRWGEFQPDSAATTCVKVEYGVAAARRHLAGRHPDGLADGASLAEVRDRLRPEFRDAAAAGRTARGNCWRGSRP